MPTAGHAMQAARVRRHHDGESEVFREGERVCMFSIFFLLLLVGPHM